MQYSSIFLTFLAASVVSAQAGRESPGGVTSSKTRSAPSTKETGSNGGKGNSTSNGEHEGHGGKGNSTSNGERGGNGNGKGGMNGGQGSKSNSTQNGGGNGKGNGGGRASSTSAMMPKATGTTKGNSTGTGTAPPVTVSGNSAPSLLAQGGGFVTVAGLGIAFAVFM